MLPRITALLTGLGFCALAHAAPTHYPLTVQNCGSTLTFAQAPARSVTIGQAATEMLYALGVANKVVGTSLWFNSVLPTFKAQNDTIERLADNEPSFEAVIAKRPQLVAAELEWVVGPQGVVGTREQFHELKIPTYLLPSDCEGKDNLVGADGTRLEPFRIDTNLQKHPPTGRDLRCTGSRPATERRTQGAPGQRCRHRAEQRPQAGQRTGLVLQRRDGQRPVRRRPQRCPRVHAGNPGPAQRRAVR
ncbi:putative ABC transporter cobalamin-binding protein [Pseudomonas fluorescens]|uniref:Putative ABC transporter cobalamin-binding protein n=1 Tax=Pseudomonas fluorescens TaxID=294 RepID=A0A8B4I9V3_PSEFL|nr:putative ABC transporter cobalamin-binding protein [Pseudomonas fluorescens]